MLLSEMAEEWQAHLEELNRLVVVEDGAIVIKASYPYDIDLERCRTHAEIIAWVMHLGSKSWITKDILRQFIRVACRENGLEIPTV